MLTKEQILEVLKTNSSMYDGAVWPSKFGAVADALLKLQGAAHEGAIPDEAALQGYITEECPPGYVAKEPPSGPECKGCAFDIDDWICNVPLSTPCAFVDRKDGKSVIFIRKEDIQ